MLFETKSKAYMINYIVILAIYGFFLPYLSPSLGIMPEDMANPKKNMEPIDPIKFLSTHVKSKTDGSAQL